MIVPILEILHLTHSHFRKLEGYQHIFLRKVCNKKSADFVHYTELFALLNEKLAFDVSLNTEEEIDFS